MHIKGIHDTVADAISRFDFGPVQDEKANWITFTKCWCYYTMHTPPEESSTNQEHQINMVFANFNEDDVIYPVTVKEIALAQERDLVLKKLTNMENFLQSLSSQNLGKLCAWMSLDNRLSKVKLGQKLTLCA